MMKIFANIQKQPPGNSQKIPMPETLCQRRLRPATLFKKETLAPAFSCEFCEVFKNTFVTEHLRTSASKFS